MCRRVCGALLGVEWWSEPAPPASRSQAKRIVAVVDGVTGELWSVQAEGFCACWVRGNPAALLRAGVRVGR